MLFQCNRMEWVHPNTTGTPGSFTVSEHKTKILFACQMLLIFIKVHSQLNQFQCYSHIKIVHNNSFKVTSNKIHTYIQFNVQVQSAVHLVVLSSCSSKFPFFPFPIYSIYTIEQQMQRLMHLT